MYSAHKSMIETSVSIIIVRQTTYLIVTSDETLTTRVCVCFLCQGIVNSVIYLILFVV